MWDAFLHYEFMRYAVYAGLLAAVACGVIGVYVVVKRIVFISGGIAHASFGGIGLGYLLDMSPVLGAMIFSVASALGIGLVTRRTRLPEDTSIGIIWASGMAMGIIFIHYTEGYTVDPITYIFGNILLVSTSDLILMGVLDALILVVVLALYKELLAVSFDEEFGTVVGVPVELLYYLLLCLIAFTVVVLIRAVGVILVIAYLTIPAALARQFTNSLSKMMVLATGLGVVFTIGGLWISYETDVPSGATIVLFSVAVLLAYVAYARLRGRAVGVGRARKVSASPGEVRH